MMAVFLVFRDRKTKFVGHPWEVEDERLWPSLHAGLEGLVATSCLVVRVKGGVSECYQRVWPTGLHALVQFLATCLGLGRSGSLAIIAGLLLQFDRAF